MKALKRQVRKALSKSPSRVSISTGLTGKEDRRSPPVALATKLNSRWATAKAAGPLYEILGYVSPYGDCLCFARLFCERQDRRARGA